MPERSASRNLPFARKLRRDMTIAETMLWLALRGSRFKGMKFRRQVPVGPYVADFLCIASKLIVELDGRPHEDDAQKAHDKKRDAYLRAQGFTVLRIPNDLVIGGCDLALRQIEIAAKA
jgi:very-short-patch-repair endonuclease